jgi:flagellar hook assembly protein FlgD
MDYFGKEPSAPGTGVTDEPVTRTALWRPAPNPSGPGATISYALAQPGHVTVRVYTAGGRLVATLVDGERDAGEYRAVWDGKTDGGARAACGVYFVRMEAAGFQASEKLVLLK